jgi:hypothetical protein
MSATTSVNPMANVLAFPVKHACPTCEAMCSPDDLSMCLRCGQEYCSQCSWECQCDRDAAEMVQRADVMRPSLWQQLRAVLAGVL